MSDLDILFPSVKLISVHLPKTAGTTFGKVILPKIYPQHSILYDYDFLPINTLIVRIQVKNSSLRAQKYGNVMR